MKSIQRDGLDYEFSLVFELDSKHYAVATKDRTRLFAEQQPFRLGEGTGQALLEWCGTGSPAITLLDEQGVRQAIRQVRTLDELVTLYYHTAPEH
ncbi:hypothetical protein [Hymenobacter gelipurpurascens]|uniref:hypothetical protein n=1 Tax=Hymenobacter gelipurpurascens TaxID=89968 RepID=UPI001BAEDAE5|nr:hypothetical protein [Hymenobacter gelipurpurascens]